MSQGYHDPQIRKQISLFLPVADWRALRDEAGRQRLSLAELCRRWLGPNLDRVRQEPAKFTANPDRTRGGLGGRHDHVWRRD